MGLPVAMKEYAIKSKVGDSLKVRIEKIGEGESAIFVYRIIRGEDWLSAGPDRVALYKEELEQIVGLLSDEFLGKEFPE